LQEGWSLSQLILVERRGIPWTGRQFITGPQRDKQAGKLESPNMHVIGLWEEAGVPGENPYMHGEKCKLYTE